MKDTYVGAGGTAGCLEAYTGKRVSGYRNQIRSLNQPLTLHNAFSGSQPSSSGVKVCKKASILQFHFLSVTLTLQRPTTTGLRPATPLCKQTAPCHQGAASQKAERARMLCVASCNKSHVLAPSKDCAHLVSRQATHGPVSPIPVLEVERVVAALPRTRGRLCSTPSPPLLPRAAMLLQRL